MDILLYQEQSSSVSRRDVKWQQLGNSAGILQLEYRWIIWLISNPQQGSSQNILKSRGSEMLL